MATSYHVTLPEIEAPGCMREEVPLRNVEESTSHSALETRVDSRLRKCKYWARMWIKSHLRTEHNWYFVAVVFCVGTALPPRCKIGGTHIGESISHIDTPPLAKIVCP
jgi:hypothetical protein